ncbi:MAG: energy-coupling factor transporter transmembrane component T family protein [Lachnospiraceae bacterium]
MIRDITLGQYYPTDSILHRLDPRVKFIGTMIYLVSIFLFHTYLGYAVAGIFLIAVLALSKVPPKFVFKGLKPIVVILIITMAFNIFLTPGTILFQYGIFRITVEGLLLAGRMGIRLLFLVTGSSLMTLTTTPKQLTDAIEKIMKPLEKIKIPVHEISMMMSIALRFIPILLEETDKIMKAQTARGADFKGGNILQRVKSLTPILIPLFVSSFRRANDLALAMESRCYHGGEGRTQMKPLSYHTQDLLAYVVLVLYLAVSIVFRVAGI